MNIIKKISSKFDVGNILVLLFCAIILLFSIRGLPGNPTIGDLNIPKWKDNGPLELSPERGRFALTFAYIELHSFSYPPDLARFVAPDVAYRDGKYLSLFVPGLSFVVIPGYLIGKSFHMAQYGTFAVISLFAMVNVFLIRMISLRLGTKKIAALIAGLTFLFATPAFPYAVTLYQHHISTFLILTSIYLLIRFNSFWSLLVIWMLAATSVAIDYPNFFMMIPIGFYGLGKFFLIKHKEGHLQITFPFLRIFTFVSIILPALFLMWYNANAYDNPFTISGNIERALSVNMDGTPQLESEVQLEALKKKGIPVSEFKQSKSMVQSFLTRNLLNGFYIHFVSPDRGMLNFTPVMFLGFAGILFAIKKRLQFTGLLVGVIGFNVLLYSMWGDPYGGWAFGSRYLIPTYAILSIFISLLLTKFSRNSVALLFFFVLVSYSVCVNTLGALTSNRNPPQIEAEGLSKLSGKEELYTYWRNAQLLDVNMSKSYMYNAYYSNSVSAWNYYTVISSSIIIFIGAILFILRKTSKKGMNEI